MQFPGFYPETSIPGIFRNRADVLADSTFLRFRDKDKWNDIAWREVKERADALTSYLIQNDIKPGDKVAIYSENRPEWIMADLAVLSAGGADVTIYPTNSSGEAAHIINDSDSRMCFCSGSFQVDNLLKIKNKLSKLKKIIVFNDGNYTDSKVITLKDALAMGRKKNNEKEIDKRIRNINPEDVMTIMYTSGTTGDPKGVMLSAKNMVSQVLHFVRHQPHPTFDIALSILPLSHALERSIGYNLLLYCGGEIAFSRGPEFLIQDLVEIRPTCMISVPRLPEKMYEGIQAKVAGAPPVKKALFGWAVKTGKKAAPYLAENRPIPGLLGRKYALAYKLVLSKLRDALGMDRMICMGTGGAPFSEEIHTFFTAMQVFILTGYGLTETAPVTHCHTHTHISPLKPGTVGPALPLTQCRIADDGEILIKSPQVMMGYYNNPLATREVLTDDGWFKTGDIGIIDKDGYLRITDRKKDIIITSGGKNIAPQVIEGDILRSTFIEQITLIGDKRKYITALIAPDFATLEKWAGENDIQYNTMEELIKKPAVIGKYQAIMDEVNKTLGRVEQVKKFTLIPNSFSQEKGEVTPTMKIKRKIVQNNYRDTIEAMYEE